MRSDSEESEVPEEGVPRVVPVDVGAPRRGQMHGVAAPWQEYSAMGKGDSIYNDGIDYEAMASDPSELFETQILQEVGIKPLPSKEVQTMRGRIKESWIREVLSHPPQVQRPKRNNYLDYTQRRPAAILEAWMRNAGRTQLDIEAPRIFLSGTAGSGKTSSIENALVPVCDRKWRDDEYPPFATCAWTGVASVNVGLGARTMSSLLKMHGGGVPTGSAFAELVERFRNLEVLVIDEVGAVEADHIDLCSDICDDVMRAVLGKSPDFEFKGGFGGLAVIAAGDFAQLAPVNPKTYVLADDAVLSTRGLSGKRRFMSFQHVIKLKVRSLGALGEQRCVLRLCVPARMRCCASAGEGRVPVPCAQVSPTAAHGEGGRVRGCMRLGRELLRCCVFFRVGCVVGKKGRVGRSASSFCAQVRARDGALTGEDYKLMASMKWTQLTSEEKKEYLGDDCLWLAAENNCVDNRNAEQLGMTAAKNKRAVYEIRARYPKAAAYGKPARCFRTHVRNKLRQERALCVTRILLLLVRQFEEMVWRAVDAWCDAWWGDGGVRACRFDEGGHGDVRGEQYV